MAQDFNALLDDLGGEGEKYIDTLDADGVALSAIQGLYEFSQQQAARIKVLEAETSAQRTQVSALRAETDDLEARLSALERRAGVPQAPKVGLDAAWLVLPGLVIVAGVAVQKRRLGGGR
jgi:hypothetical protein